MKIMYDEQQLSSLMADVEKEFSKHLAKAEKSFGLAKSEFPPKKDESKKEDEKKASSESSGEEKKPMETEKPEDKGVKDQDQQSEDKPGENDQEQPGMAAKDGAAPADEDHGYDDEDMGHMHSMYSSMSKPELKAHHDAVRKCLEGMGMAKCEDGMAKAEMEDCAKDAEGYRPNGGPKDGQSEKEGKGPASTGAQALEKSEPSMEISMLKSELEAAKAETAAVAAFLKKFVEKTAPAGKAITSLDIIAKTESGQNEKPLTKSEIDAKLLAKAKDVSLTKSDRDAINSYYFSKNVESVRHLLK
jgi:hypothetical protein